MASPVAISYFLVTCHDVSGDEENEENTWGIHGLRHAESKPEALDISYQIYSDIIISRNYF
jgi:hypothetical protein